MKRLNNIIEQIVEYENIENSVRAVIRGRKRKRSLQGRYILAHYEEIIRRIKEEISSGTFRVKRYHEANIIEGGKLRRIQILTIYDRIAVHAIMNIVDDIFKKKLIRTTSASIKGRGTHDLLNYIKNDIKNDPAGTLYCFKFDVKKFYESIDHDVMIMCLHRVFKDKILLVMLESFVRLMPKGLSIGLRSSQGFGNLILSQHLDHYLKDELGVKYFYRYCDDGVILSDSKAKLWELRSKIIERLNSIKLEIKASERIFPITEGIDFLGYKIYSADYVKLRKRVKKNFAKRFKKIISKNRKRELIASFYGMSKHANCAHLFKSIIGFDMKKFKDLNIVYNPVDGKKRFPGDVISVRELVNLPVIVIDFETDIKTGHGEGRAVISVEVNGIMKKFFTASEELKNILEQVRSLNGFPFETVIKSEQFGKGKTKYIFS